MALVANLEAGFGAGGFDLSVSVTGMGGVLDGATIPPVSVDEDALTAIIDGLESPDLADLGAAISAVVSDLGGIVDLLPGAGDLLGPLQVLLDAAQLGSTLPDLAAALAEIDSTRSGNGIAVLVAAIHAGSGILTNPTATSLTDLLESAVPGFDPGGIAALVGSIADGAEVLIGLVGALMSIESVTRDLVAGFDVTASFLDQGRIQLDLTRLSGWAATDALVDLVIGIDPDDIGIVDLVAGPLIDYAITVRRLGEAVVTSMAWGEATLVGLDLDGLVARLGEATAQVTSSVLAPVNNLVATLRDRIEALMSFDLPQPPTLDDFVDGLGGLATQLASAIDEMDPSAIARPIGDALDTVMHPLTSIETVAHEVVASAGAAFGAVRQAVTTVDIRPITDGIATVLAPFTEALEALDSLVAAVEGAVGDAATAIDGLIEPVRSGLSEAAELITSAFAAVDQLITDLHLEEIGPTLTAGAQQVATAISAAQLKPVFDAIVSALDVTATALSLTPRDLLPDDVKAALEAGCGQLQQVDLESTREALRTELQSLRDEVDVTVLDVVREAQLAVVEFLDEIDPEGPISELENGPFAELVSRLREADLMALLAPVLDAIDEATAVITGFDPIALLEPLDEALDVVSQAIQSIDPTELLEPVEQQLAGLRTTLVDTLDLDGWDDRLDAVSGAISRFLKRFDLSPVTTALDGAHAALVASAAQPALGAGPLGTLVSALVEGAGLRVRPDTFDAVRNWLTGEASPSQIITERLVGAQSTVQRLADAVAAIDLVGTIGPLSAHHSRLIAALHVHPDTSLLRLRVDAELTGASPGDLLGPVVANRDRYLTALQSASGALSQLTSASRSELDAAASGLRSAAAPLVEVVARVRSLIAAVTGVEVEGRPIRDILVELLGRVRPSLIFGALVTSVHALRDRCRAAVDQAVIEPLRNGLDTIRSVIDVLDISFIRTEIEAIRDDVLGAIDSLRPAAILGDAGAALSALQNRIATVDPLGPVRSVVDGLSATIDTFESEFRPTALTAGALTAYDRVTSAIASLAVDDVLQPVLSALDGIEAQLEDGMDDLIDALHGVQDACASGGPSLGAALGAASDLVGGLSGGGSVGGSFGL